MCPTNDKKSKKEYLLARIGGKDALQATVDEFYNRLVEDKRIAHFFEGYNMKFLRAHQFRFMSIAFTEVPEGLNIADLISKKHQKLFERGLNEIHFDIVATHLVETLQHLGVAKPLIDEVVEVVSPLRSVFEEGSKQARVKKEKNKREHLLTRIGGEDALRAAVDEFYNRLVKDERIAHFFEGYNMKLLRAHQFRFMSIAFTEVPEGLDVAALISKKHQKLFEKGLNEKHFDIVATHLVETLQHLGVAKPLIDEVVGVVSPLRSVFEEGSK